MRHLFHADWLILLPDPGHNWLDALVGCQHDTLLTLENYKLVFISATQVIEKEEGRIKNTKMGTKKSNEEKEVEGKKRRRGMKHSRVSAYREERLWDTFLFASSSHRSDRPFLLCINNLLT